MVFLTAKMTDPRWRIKDGRLLLIVNHCLVNHIFSPEFRLMTILRDQRIKNYLNTRYRNLNIFHCYHGNKIHKPHEVLTKF